MIGLFFCLGFCGGCGLVFVVGCDFWDRVILDGEIEYFDRKGMQFCIFLKSKNQYIIQIKKT